MKLLRNVFLSLVALGVIAYFISKQMGINPPIKPIVKISNTDLPLEDLKLPAGFHIDIYAEDVVNARSLDISPNGTLFIGTRGEGSVYAVVDSDGDKKADQKYTLMEGGNMPNGVAFKDGDLYVAEVNRILKFSDIESKLENPGEPEVIFDGYPTESHHGWKYINFGPDGKLYVPVGAPCNMCESEKEIYASMTRINTDGTGLEIVQKGIRNSVGFDWDPKTGDLWFTDNGRDMMGDDIPNCELNHATKDNMHFGYPYCHQGDVLDPEFGKGKDCDDYTGPADLMGPHNAPLGMEFYTGDLFPSTFKNNMIIARHGSWNRAEKAGYNLILATPNASGGATHEPFISGWLSDDKKDVWGRPVDVEMMSDGSLLVSDDFADVVYRVTYDGAP